MQETKAEIQLKETKSSTEEWLDEANRLEEQGKYEQAEQIRAKYLGYEYISQEQLETIKALALDPAKKEAEVKKERKQLFQYAVNHRQYDWINALAKLQFQRAILFMKEIRNERKEYDKYIRLGNKPKVLSITQKYGIDFTLEDNSTGLMLAASYGQTELLNEFLSKGASRTLLDSRNRFALDYLFDTYLKTKIQKQIQNSKQRQTQAQKQMVAAEDKLLIGFWDKLKPQTIEYEAGDRLFKIGAHSMLFFLILLLRNRQDSQKYKAHHQMRPELGEVGIFNMDDLEQLAALIPDEILPPYRKKRTYINSIMALNEVHKDSPYCKFAVRRLDRGRYILNPELIYNSNNQLSIINYQLTHENS